jgi:hypothetical protein
MRARTNTAFALAVGLLYPISPEALFWPFRQSLQINWFHLQISSRNWKA